MICEAKIATNLLDDVETMFKRFEGRETTIVTVRRNGAITTEAVKVGYIGRSAQLIHIHTDTGTYTDIQPELVQALPANLMIPSSQIHIRALASETDVMPRGIMVGYPPSNFTDGMVMYRLFLVA
jgi:hypothetical protein